MTSITRTPEGAQFSLTVAPAESVDLGSKGTWAAICDGHESFVVTQTKDDALELLPWDFCEKCADHHYGIGKAS